MSDDRGAEFDRRLDELTREAARDPGPGGSGPPRVNGPPPGRGGARRPEGPDVVTLSSVEFRQTTWVRRGWLALGKLTVLDGMPDVGKSTVAASWIARATTGATFPGGGAGFGRPTDVLVLASTEDSLHDTVAPRIAAAGGDLARVHVLTGIVEGGERRPFALPDDMAHLLDLVERYGAKFIYLDSLMASLPADVNSYRDQDVRRALWPLAELADESGAAVAFVRHPTKGGTGPAMYRGGGSVGIVGVARAALFALKDPEDESGTKRLLAIAKCNGIPEAEKVTTAFTVQPASVADSTTGLVVEVGRVTWGQTDPRGADELVRAADQGDVAEGVDAAEIITETLRDKPPMTARQLDDVRAEWGIGRHTWEAARARLRRKGSIMVDQEGKEGSEVGGKGPAIWSWVGPPGTSGGPTPGDLPPSSDPNIHGASDEGGRVGPPSPGDGGPTPHNPSDDPSDDSYATRFREHHQPLFPDVADAPEQRDDADPGDTR